jgi:hypothetical protein
MYKILNEVVLFLIYLLKYCTGLFIIPTLCSVISLLFIGSLNIFYIKYI